MTHSPRLSMPATAHTRAPDPTTDVELGALTELTHRLGARTVVVGHGRDDASCASAARFARHWEGDDRVVLEQVSWPEEAASWLRQARRLVDPEPDLWILGGAAAGLAQMTRRLAWSTPWEPRRTLALGSNSVHEAMRLAGAGVLEGLRGAHPDGTLWCARGGHLEPMHPAEVERSDQ